MKPALKPNEAAHFAASSKLNAPPNAKDPSTLLPALPQGAEILIVRLRSLGDMVLETPVIAALHSWRPDLRIIVLVEPRFAPVLEGNPAIAELIFSRGLGETALDLLRRKIPIVFNQHGGPRSAMLTGASGSPFRVGWAGYQYSFFYNVAVPDAQEFYGTPAVHTVEHRISQFYFTGLPRGPIPRAQVFPQPDAAASVARKLAEKGIALGARDDEIAAEVRSELQNCAAVMDAQLDMRELIALIAAARIVVGNDSGPAHLAAALQRPSVVIFGVTDPVQWRPWLTDHRIVQTGATFNHPRGDKAVMVTNPRPISSVTVDEVRQNCEELLASG